MNVDYWIQFLKTDPQAYKDFLRYLDALHSRTLRQFQTTKTFEEVKSLQGYSNALEEIVRDLKKENKIKEQ